MFQPAPGSPARLNQARGAGLFFACALTSVAALQAPAEARASEPPVVHLYGSYGHQHYLKVWGRVLEDDEAPEPDEHEGAISNTVANLRTLESDEIPGAKVNVTVQGRLFSAVSDEEGIFVVEVNNPEPPFVTGPHTVQAVAPELEGAPSAEGVAYLADAAGGTIVVSDIDDTVLQTGVRNKLRMAVDVLTRNALQLAPVPGAPDAYRQAIDDGVMVIYLSGSPINFSKRLDTFLRKWRFPLGPVLLKNFGEASLTDQHGYKGERLRHLMSVFARHCFVLVGDSGEQDPEIYQRARDEGGRVGAIVIRQVVGDTDDARLQSVLSVPNFLPPLDLTQVIRDGCGATAP